MHGIQGEQLFTCYVIGSAEKDGSMRVLHLKKIHVHNKSGYISEEICIISVPSQPHNDMKLKR